MATRPIRQSFNILFCFVAVCVASACVTTKQPDVARSSPKETGQEEAFGALGTIAGSYTGKELSEGELKQLAQDLEKDQEAKSAVGVIADSLEGNNKTIKYSPATGKRYSGDLEFDPETGVKLLPLEQ